MVDGFINDNFTADGSITANSGAITNQITATAFDSGYSLYVPGGWVSNLGITYASSTLSVASATGAALSATNPGYVILQDKSSPGQLRKYTITANQGFIDDTGASEIIGNLFGMTTGIAYTEDVPFYIYAVTNDAEDTIQFMISRVQAITISPTAAKIGAPDDAVADDQSDFFSFDNIDETLYNQNPCVCIGSFRMRMSAADDWTVQALDFEDGIGMFQIGRRFTFPTGVGGAAAGTHWQDNGGTAPAFTGQTYFYYMYLDGSASIYYTGSNLNNAPAGNVVARLTPVFRCSSNRAEGPSQWDDPGGGGNVICCMEWYSSQDYGIVIAASVSRAMLNSDFGATDNFISSSRMQIRTNV